MRMWRQKSRSGVNRRWVLTELMSVLAPIVQSDATGDPSDVAEDVDNFAAAAIGHRLVDARSRIAIEKLLIEFDRVLASDWDQDGFGGPAWAGVRAAAAQAQQDLWNGFKTEVEALQLQLERARRSSDDRVATSIADDLEIYSSLSLG